jgi:biopolymer transport protein ExbD
MISGAGFMRKSKANSDIPSASLADMAFLLLIFFMVSTTFRKEKQRKIDIPLAAATQKLSEPRKDVLHIWLMKDGSIYINDENIPPDKVSNVVAPLYAENRNLVMELRADSDVPYHFVNNVEDQLEKAGAVRLTFYTNVEEKMARERR